MGGGEEEGILKDDGTIHTSITSDSRDISPLSLPWTFLFECDLECCHSSPKSYSYRAVMPGLLKYPLIFSFRSS
ncbi:MAG: hypothetical protein D5R99_02320 [Methanocalculus sp. MSAO_Arc1]|nr:MAG: hypothetical protein D5R99_02320 [Methanocalculus sp. MSAO_Arc1]